MTADRLALYTTIYPAAVPFLGQWHRSVSAQVDQGFDLWVGLDGMTPETVSAAVGTAVRAEWVDGGPAASPTRLRSVAMQAMVQRYPAIVFVDSDDTLLPSRVGAARAQLDDVDVGACALELMDADGRELGITFGPPTPAAAADLLPHANAFGLSNTVYRSTVLRDCLPLPDACVLVDWLLASRAWGLGARLGFDGEAHMRYRQHAANVASFRPPFTAAQVLAATEKVANHFHCLLSDGAAMDAVRAQAFVDAGRRVSRFRDVVRREPAVLHEYVSRLNAMPPTPLWWWQVAHPALENLWTR